MTFRVDAYPRETFTGTVSQVRLEPVVAQNVVSYVTVIDVPNKELKLKPGMTANVTVEIARADDVLRVPNAALRFRAAEASGCRADADAERAVSWARRWSARCGCMSERPAAARSASCAYRASATARRRRSWSGELAENAQVVTGGS